jgi:PAS domain S-box-containing protein
MTIASETEAQGLSLFEAAGIGLVHVGQDGSCLRVNEAFCAMLGYGREELLRLRIQNLLHADDLDRELQDASGMLAKGRQSHCIRRSFVRRDGGLLWADLTISQAGESADGPSFVIAAVDASEPVELQAALAGAEQGLDLAVKVGGLACWKFNPASGFHGLANRLAGIHGLWPDEIRPAGREPCISVHPDDLISVANAIRSAAAASESFACDIRLLHGIHDERWIALSGACVAGPQTTTEFVCVSRDITSSKTAEPGYVPSEELLARELNHRLRNVFPIILMIVKLTARFYPQAASYSKSLELRLRALAAAEHLMHRSESDSAHIEELIRLELSPFKNCARMTIRGPVVKLRGAVAQSFAILLHELATNSVKHGSLSAPHGRLDVSWRFSARADRERVFVFEWLERGGKSLDAVPCPGFGTTLINESGSLLGGTASAEYAPEGLRYRLEILAGRL